MSKTIDNLDTVPWALAGAERMEIAGFLLFALVTTALSLIYRYRRPGTATHNRISMSTHWMRTWRNAPEIQLIMLALPLELLWETAQFPLYSVWHQNDWVYILYGLAHCTLGDLMILLVIYELIALLNRNRHWYAHKIIINGSLFTVIGAGYTVVSEIMNVRVKGTWGYTEHMPIIPFLEIGGTPFLQWVLIPPVLLWLMRLISPARNHGKQI